MKSIKSICLIAVAILSAVFLIGCGVDSTSDTGTLTLSVTDAPVDMANRVVVKFSGVEVNPASGELLSFSISNSIDLLALSGGGSEALLAGKTLEAGSYTWIRLIVNAQSGVLDSYIELTDGSQHSLEIPSGSETGLKLVRGFDVPAGGSADFTIDFDLRKSIHNSSTGYMLRPALRIVDNTEVGSIAGTVDSALINGTGGNAVYAFEGSGITPDDVDGISPEPINAALVELESSGDYTYKVAFLNAGDYTVAFTNSADADDPTIDDSITNSVSFVGVANATVTAGGMTQHNF